MHCPLNFLCSVDSMPWTIAACGAMTCYCPTTPPHYLTHTCLVGLVSALGQVLQITQTSFTTSVSSISASSSFGRTNHMEVQRVMQSALETESAQPVPANQNFNLATALATLVSRLSSPSAWFEQHATNDTWLPSVALSLKHLPHQVQVSLDSSSPVLSGRSSPGGAVPSSLIFWIELLDAYVHTHQPTRNTGNVLPSSLLHLLRSDVLHSCLSMAVSIILRLVPPHPSLAFSLVSLSAALPIPSSSSCSVATSQSGQAQLYVLVCAMAKLVGLLRRTLTLSELSSPCGPPPAGGPGCSVPADQYCCPPAGQA